MVGTRRSEVVRKVALAEIKDQLSKFLRDAGKEDILITRHGKPAGVLIGFETEDDWFDYKLENDPRFLQRIERARQSMREGRGVRIEELSDAQGVKSNKRLQRTAAGKTANRGGSRPQRGSKGGRR
jgi:prevent-host-death family protein